MIFLVNLCSVLDTESNSDHWELGSPRKNRINWHHSSPLILTINLNMQLMRNSKLGCINECSDLRGSKTAGLRTSQCYISDTSTALRHLSWARNAIPEQTHPALLPPCKHCIRMRQSKNYTDVTKRDTADPCLGNNNLDFKLATEGKKSNLIWSFMEIFLEFEIMRLGFLLIA